MAAMAERNLPPGGNGPALNSPCLEPYLRLQSVTIFVRDIERSLKFYVEQLGFTLVFDARVQAGRRWAAVMPPDGSANLTLAEAEEGSPEFKLMGRSTHISFVTEDVPARFREWRRRGVRFLNTPRLRRLKFGVQVARRTTAAGADPIENPSPIWGGVFTRFQDPDGNSFSLVSFDEVSREVEAQRRVAAAKLEAERRAAQEMEIARQVQSRLFPQSQPTLRTLEYAGVCLQARQVGGDYYDFLNLGRERLGLVIGDIAGKGIAAALLMANLQAYLRSQTAVAGDEPRRCLRVANELFFESTIDTAYATLFFAEYNDRAGRLRYANCGHLAPLIVRPRGGLERLAPTTTVLGMFEDWDCPVADVKLGKGDHLVLYTDGLTEAENPRGEEFGETRLIETVRAHRTSPAESLVKSVVETVQEFSRGEQADDITLVVARRKE